MKKAKLHCLHVGAGLELTCATRIFSLRIKAQQPWIISQLHSCKQPMYAQEAQREYGNVFTMFMENFTRFDIRVVTHLLKAG
ncbi:hypothetical protein F2P81_020811 [Scophthalmus maximus]|uniref:Uncharacterized protein n=1 Tax=Scophthalmus maximus TaxID=52904 RepID=A0A6A4S692_SCOMX|nr:hypothetical protein F2P81_020811 [Scophthalmus maximus]